MGMGAGQSLMYSAAYPEHVNHLIMLDAVNGPRNTNSVANQTRASIEDLLNIEGKLSFGKKQIFTYEEALKRLLEGSHQMHGENSITEDSAKMLLERGLKKATESEEHEDKWEFTRDLRHLVRPLYGYAYEIINTVSSEVKCPHLII